MFYIPLIYVPFADLVFCPTVFYIPLICVLLADLVFCHRPDPVTPIEETVRAMNWVIDQGLAFYWGTSEWTARDVTEACRIADLLGMIRPAFEQPEYSIVSRQRVEHEYAPLYR